MKKAFTMLELIVVIVVIGILAAMAIPRLDRDNLAEAVDQIISHLRYTQHLAMQDNRFNPNDPGWTRERWTLAFAQVNNVCGRDNGWKYSIYQDLAGARTGNLNSANEVARDPLDHNQFMSAGWAGISNADCQNTNAKYDIRAKFGITQVAFGGGCARVQGISFDEFGRPMITASTTTMAAAAPPRPYQRILNANCTITLQNSNGRTAVITIVPETGFASVVFN